MSKFCKIISDEIELFANVKHKKPQIEGLFGSYLMDQQQKQFKAVIDDGGEFSDEVCVIFHCYFSTF
jgi:hypothetical protein